ncbi:MAG: hypothetical protein GY851_13715 [bacterium]|nr:hypothetical protein [bacterium]
MSDDQQRRLPPIFRARTIIVLLLLMVLGAYGLYRWHLDSRLQAALDAVEADGTPLTLANLNAWYATPPDEEDATGTLLLAFDSLRHLPPAQEDLLPIVGKADPLEPGVPIPAMQLALIDKYLSENARALELIYEGSAMGRARWPVDLTAGAAMLFPHNNQMREAARLLALETLAKAEHGDVPGALDAVKASVGLSGCLADEPLLISQFVRLACLGLAADAATHVIGHGTLTDAQLTELDTILKNAEPVGGVALALTGERCFFLSSVGLTGPKAGTPSVMTMVVGTAYNALGLTAMDQGFMLNEFEELIRIANLPADEQWAALKAHRDGRAEPGRLMLLSQMLIPAVGRASESELRFTAELRAVRAAIAVERYRLEHGAYPDTAEEVAAQFPKDPFADAPILYKRLDGGYVTYSVGADERDDGGPQAPGEEERSPRPRMELKDLMKKGMRRVRQGDVGVWIGTR